MGGPIGRIGGPVGGPTGLVGGPIGGLGGLNSRFSTVTITQSGSAFPRVVHRAISP